MDYRGALYTECVLAERVERVKVDVAERKLAFLGRTTSSLWKSSHHGDH